MSSSEEPEIIQRSRLVKRPKRVLYESDYGSDDSISKGGDQAGEYEPLFVDVFGTGHEYDYIYAAEKESAPSMDHMLQTGDGRVDEAAFNAGYKEACAEFVRSRALGPLAAQITTELVGMCVDGFPPEYMAFYASQLSVKEAYYVCDLVGEYPAYRKMLEGRARGTDGDEKLPGFLSVVEYVNNLAAKERLAEPSGEVAGDAHSYKPLAMRISAKPVFRDLVNLQYEQLLLFKNSTATNGMLSRLFTTDEESQSNRVRGEVIEEARRLVSVDLKGINERLLISGSITAQEASKHLNTAAPTVDGSACEFRTIFEDLPSLTNAIASLKGPEGSYAGIFHDRGFCKITCIDERGRAVGSAAFKDSDVAGILGYVSSSTNICITSTSAAVRYLIPKLGGSLIYVPRSLSFFGDLKEFSISYDIAFLAQNPFVYFSRLLYGSYFSGTKQQSAYVPYRDTILKRAIRTALAAYKMDWKAALCHQYSHTLFYVLDLPLSQRYFDYAGVTSLEDLRTIFAPTSFASLATFFVLDDSSNPLDATPVHPKDYSLATVLCKSAYVIHKERDTAGYDGLGKNDDAQIVAELLENLHVLRDVRIPDGADALHSIKEMLLSKKPEPFRGATDRQIFNDVVCELGELAAGVVVKVGRDFYIVECAVASEESGHSVPRTATVYIRKDSEYALNQLVTVRISGPSYQTLSYNGDIVDSPAAQSGRLYIKHRLFRNMDHGSLVRLMEQDNQKIMVRPSSEADCCVVICKLQSGVYAPIKVRVKQRGAAAGGASDDGSWEFVHNNHIYSGLDEFINDYIRRLYRIVYSITSYKHYYRSEAEALAYVGGSDQYMRYAVILSVQAPGCLEFLFANKRVLVRIEADRLVYKNHNFPSIDAFISFAKGTFK
ncbi:hypothetical protein PAPHI01_1254 [Pancytospora philotis]|nr:hypothetical protein PAPHI01_1254 [Pancytospora philotis]